MPQTKQKTEELFEKSKLKSDDLVEVILDGKVVEALAKALSPFIKQIIDENVSGRSSLQLRINFTILYQELKVCGGQGSDCPLMVKINYQNKQGVEHGSFHASSSSVDSTSYNGSGDQNVNAAGDYKYRQFSQRV